MTFISIAPTRRNDGLSQVWTPASAAAATTAVMAILALALLWLPGFPAGRHAQHLAALLDGGYRIDRGHLPHLDFIAPYGCLTLFQGWLALRFEPVFPPFAVMLTSSFALVAPAMLLVARRQAGVAQAVAVVLVASVMLLAPIVIEPVPVNEFNFNGVANRNAGAALFLGFAWIIMPKRPSLAEAALLTGLLLLAFWWKAPHALALLLVLFVHGLMAHPMRWLVIRSVFLFEAALLLIDLATRGMVRAYMADIAEMMRVNGPETMALLSGFLGRNLPALIATGVAVVVMPLWWRRGLRHAFLRPFVVARSLRPAIAAVVMLLAVIGVESQSAASLGLMPALALGLGPLRPDRHRSGPALAAVVALALIAYPAAESLLRRSMTLAIRQTDMHLEPATGPVLSRSFVSFRLQMLADAYQALWRKPEQANGDVASALATFARSQNPTEAAQGIAWAREVAAAAALARTSGLVRPGMKVMSVGYAEPFARLLGAMPMEGGYLWLDPQSTVRDLDAAQAAMLLNGADAVFVQLCARSPQFEAMVEGPFSAALRHGFVPAIRTHCYEVWLQRR